ncbi:RNA exonuclease 4 [Acanthopagrus latus]|uniref:RNA exonuclease 4 n=1 Tax=Acanthopagrus latus TaxID=8177 RepID=UPI00187CED90|nr:RNA exonuclease 4 [Acanthopagrus latus]
MSKVQTKKTESSAKTRRPKSSETQFTAKKKRKQWLEVKYVKLKPPPQKKEKPKVQQTQNPQPPKDAQDFSSNWKTLQEVLKVSQPAKKKPVPPKPHNGALQKKKAEETSSKDISKNNICPKQTDTVKKTKHKTAPATVVPEVSQVNLKVPGVSGQPATLKRKKEGGKSDGEQAAKKNKPAVEERKPTSDDLWFDDVDPDDIEATVGAEAAEIMRRKQGVKKHKDTESALVKEKAFEGLTRAVAIDCEMVGVGPNGEDSLLARVSLVNHFGKCIYDKYVKPTEKVTDYRTEFSGIRPEDIKDGEDVRTVQREVADILKGRIVVGHAIHNDLKILLLDHPKKKIRDTQKYKPFQKIAKTSRPALRVLCRQILNVNVQQGEHSSVQDAQATMRLYTLVRKQWEKEIKESQQNKDSDKKRNPKLPKKEDKKPVGL